jgi:hypothetical protein
MADSPEGAVKEALDLEVARSERRFTELHSRLLGYEIAITAIIGALDTSGALPLAAAKSALDAAADVVSAQHLTSSGALTVLAQLSARLEPPEAEDSEQE